MAEVKRSDRRGKVERASSKGAPAFEAYYEGIYGLRWAALRTALTAPPRHVTLEEGLIRAYYLDAASVAVAHLLPLAAARDVVDLCAAPGGKALVLAGRLGNEAPEATLTLNERSRRRRERLQRVVADHLPPDARGIVTVTGHDASRWGLHHPGSADAILADVPCSSEQHVIADETHLARWSHSRVRRLSIEQGAILAAATDSLRPGGYVLYVTCALTPEENDAVVGKILRKRGDRVAVVADPREATSATGRPPRVAEVLAAAERTEFGLAILPDAADGAGPLYCALLRREQGSERE
jgi:16S rRNA C967 or C1407 C5-methylase (RsmB/RsmF family)